MLVNLGLIGNDAPGLELIRRTKATRPQVGILSLKRQVEEHLLRAALDAGADACCLATTSESRLRSAIKAVAEGATWLDPEISRILLHPSGPAPAGSRPERAARRRRAAPLAARDRDPAAGDRGLHQRRDRDQPELRRGDGEDPPAPPVPKLGVHDRVSAAVRGLRRGIV